AAARAAAFVDLDPRHDRLHGGNVDLVPGAGERLIGLAEFGPATTAPLRHHAHDLVGIFARAPMTALASETALARPGPFGRLRIGLEVLRRRQARIVARLRRLLQSRLELGHPPNEVRHAPLGVYCATLGFGDAARRSSSSFRKTAARAKASSSLRAICDRFAGVLIGTLTHASPRRASRPRPTLRLFAALSHFRLTPTQANQRGGADAQPTLDDQMRKRILNPSQHLRGGNIGLPDLSIEPDREVNTVPAFDRRIENEAILFAEH